MIQQRLIALTALTLVFGVAGTSTVACNGDDDLVLDDAGTSSSGGSSGYHSPVDAGIISPDAGDDSCFAAKGPSGLDLAAAPLHQGACAAADIAAFDTACLADAATQATCTAFQSDAAKATCNACIYGADGGTTFPALMPITLLGQEYRVVNTDGCIAAFVGAPLTADCAVAASNVTICQYANCSTCEDATEATAPLLSACLDEAQATKTTGCRDLVEKASCVQDAATANGISQAQIDAACSGDSFEQLAVHVVSVLCGVDPNAPPSDAGTPADAGTSDSDAGDAAP